MPVVVEQADRRKRRMVREILPTHNGLTLFITIASNAVVAQEESMPQAVLASAETSPHRSRHEHSVDGVSLWQRADTAGEWDDIR